jgi:hypothetical protein
MSTLMRPVSKRRTLTSAASLVVNVCPRLLCGGVGRVPEAIELDWDIVTQDTTSALP